MLLKEYLNKNNITKDQFAVLANINRRTLDAYFERRRRPTITRAKQISEITKGEVTVEDLRGITDNFYSNAV
jgi:hypothetical protein